MIHKPYKLCLGIDTASDTTSVALLDSDGRQVVEQVESARGQGEILFHMIEKVFQQMKKTPQELTHIAVTIGPGSFTGVRIGLATARGLGLALKIPVIGVNNFDATAYGLNQAVTVVLDSKRNDYFTQRFDAHNNPMGEPKTLSSDYFKENQKLCISGSGAQKLANEVSCTLLPPIAPLALNAAYIALHAPSKTTEPHPLYLRDADVTI